MSKIQEGSRIDSEPNFRNRKSANVKNRNVSSTESLQPSIFQTQPNRKEKRTVPLCSAVTFFQTVQSLEFQSSSPPLECPYSMSLARPGFRRIHKMLSFPFPFPCFPFQYAYNIDGMEKAYSLIAFLPVHVHFLFLSFAFPDIVLSFPCPFLSNMFFRLPGKSILPYLSFSFSCPLLCFPFLPFPFPGFPFQYAFWKAWKKHIHKLHSFPCFSFSIAFLCVPFLFFPFLK